MIAALAKTRIVTRGPKPVRALKEIGLTPSLVAPQPTTEGVIAALTNEPLQGKTVAVQLYSDANPPLTHFLTQAGADACAACSRMSTPPPPMPSASSM